MTEVFEKEPKLFFGIIEAESICDDIEERIDNWLNNLGIHSADAEHLANDFFDEKRRKNFSEGNNIELGIRTVLPPTVDE